MIFEPLNVHNTKLSSQGGSLLNPYLPTPLVHVALLKVRLKHANVMSSMFKSYICMWIQDVYKMSSVPRGFAVLLTMTINRKGAEADTKSIETLFSQLQFEVHTIMDKPKKVYF